jgi:hypothetical protein
MTNRLIDTIRTTLGLVILLAVTGQAAATEYIYRDILGDSAPNAKCAVKDQAAARAAEAYYVDRAAKTFCEVQGYGWHLAELSNQGELVCEECRGADHSQGLFQCHMQDIAVKCQRIKPGSVGLIPGKG